MNGWGRRNLLCLNHCFSKPILIYLNHLHFAVYVSSHHLFFRAEYIPGICWGIPGLPSAVAAAAAAGTPLLPNATAHAYGQPLLPFRPFPANFSLSPQFPFLCPCCRKFPFLWRLKSSFCSLSTLFLYFVESLCPNSIPLCLRISKSSFLWCSISFSWS